MTSLRKILRELHPSRLGAAVHRLELRTVASLRRRRSRRTPIALRLDDGRLLFNLAVAMVMVGWRARRSYVAWQERRMSPHPPSRPETDLPEVPRHPPAPDAAEQRADV
jgi:hypothetical protein